MKIMRIVNKQLTLEFQCNNLGQRSCMLWSCTGSELCMKAESNKPVPGRTSSCSSEPNNI